MLIPRVIVRNRAQLILVAIWIALFHYFLIIRPNDYASSCSWSDNDESLFADHDASNNPYKVLIIADPQLIDNHTYPGRNPYLLSLSKHVVDSYIYTNYNALIKQLKPESVIFLGDLLDNGRESSDSYYYGEVVRFRRIFKRFGTINDFYFHVPGNHDIGWANGVTEHALNRFTNTFAKPNTLITKHGHDLIFFDSISYSNTENENVYRESHQFLEELASSEKVNPRIMFGHVPLYRPTDAKCGPYRESSTFPVSAGYQYQTVIDEQYSKTILDSIKPDLLFSGDDHDYCEYFHGDDKTPEITVKSISMAMGIRRPAVQLLTLYDKDKPQSPPPTPIKDHQGDVLNDSPSYHYNICFLPKPYIDSIIYGMYAGINVLVLFILSIHKSNPYNQHRQLRSRRANISSMLNNYLHTTGEEGNEDESDIALVSTIPVGQQQPSTFPSPSPPAPPAPTSKAPTVFARLNLANLVQLVVPQGVVVLTIYTAYNLSL